MIRISCETWLVVFGTLVAIFLRCCTTIHPYSGMGNPPMYGDYEAQRHWMEVTTNLPMKDWYHNTSDNDLMYWGLDYPPLTAYHMYFCGKVAEFLNDNYTKLHDSRGYESEQHKLFMRYTVLIADVAIYIPAIIIYYYSTLRQKKSVDTAIKKAKAKTTKNFNESKPMPASLCIVLGLLYPGIILIDHGHFQYNCISLGFTILATVLLLKKLNILASVFFCLALNYKQMELYHALPFFLYLLSTCVPKPGKTYLDGFLRLFKIGITVIITFLIIWLPFIFDVDNLLQVLHRQFPFARGVFEDKVSNIWCALNIFYKFKNRFDNHDMMRLCLFTTLSAIFPSSVDLFLRPNLRKFVLALINSSLAFFLFSYQVHEKTILLVAIPVLMYFPYAPFECFWFSCITVFSMLPLFIKDGLLPAVVALTLFYVVAFRVSIEHAYRSLLNSNDSFKDYYANVVHILLDIEYKKCPKDLVKKTYQQIIKNHDTIRTFIFHIVMSLSLFGCVVLFIASQLFEPPEKYPDLFPLLISVYSCVHFVGFFVYFNVMQLRIPQQFEDVRNVKVKDS